MFSLTKPDPHSLLYLRCNQFIDTVVKSRALKTALDIGLIDFLLSRRTSSISVLAQGTNCDLRGTSILCDLLLQSGVLSIQNEDISFSTQFLECLPFFDILLAKLLFSFDILSDLANNFTALIQDPVTFQEESALLSFFCHSNISEIDPVSYGLTNQWIHYASTLSFYEAPPLLSVLEFSGKESLLDIGGNSGAFALRLCQLKAVHNASIFDLPFICNLGLNHTFNKPFSKRLSFHPGDLRSHSLPRGYNLHVFKSVLHDWSEDDVISFLKTSTNDLDSGGRLIIYERVATSFPRQSKDSRSWDFCDLPVLLFTRSYRDPNFYVHCLNNLGMRIDRMLVLSLDHDFCVIEAFKP